MTTTEQLIASLSSEPMPVAKPNALGRLALCWLVIASVYAVFNLCFSGARADFATKLTEPLYVIELLNLLALIITSLFSAMLLSFPDMHQQRPAVILPAVPAVGLLAALAAGLKATPIAPASDGMECLICIVLYSALPAIWAMLCLKRQATTRPRATGAMVVLAATAIGALTVRVVEANDSLPHLLAWHYAPMLVCAGLGAFIGQKMLRW